MDKKFYVYEWYRVIDHHVFYVGKGTGTRFAQKHARTQMFKEYLEKHECKSRKIKYFDNEIDALNFESEMIKKYKNEKSCECNILDNSIGFTTNNNIDFRKNVSINNPMKKNRNC